MGPENTVYLLQYNDNLVDELVLLKMQVELNICIKEALFIDY